MTFYYSKRNLNRSVIVAVGISLFLLIQIGSFLLKPTPVISEIEAAGEVNQPFHRLNDCWSLTIGGAGYIAAISFGVDVC